MPVSSINGCYCEELLNYVSFESMQSSHKYNNIFTVFTIDEFNKLTLNSKKYINYLIVLNDENTEFNLEAKQIKYINGNITIKGNLKSSNQIVNLAHIVINGTLNIDIAQGHINLCNIRCNNINVISVGLESIVFNNGSSTKNLNIVSNKPVHIKIAEGASVSIDNMNIAPSGTTLEKSNIKLTGNFGRCNITVKTSSTIQAGYNFKSSIPIVINASKADTVALMGDFSLTRGIVLQTPTNIFASNASPPFGLNLEISPDNAISPILLNGNFTNTKIIVEKQTSLLCSGEINELIINKSANSVSVELIDTTVITNLTPYNIMELTGEKGSVEKTLATATNLGYIVVKEMFEALGFVNGVSNITTKIDKTGNYLLVLSIKQGDSTLLFNKTLSVTII